MKDLEDKLGLLKANYQELLSYYQGIAEQREKEINWIQKNDMESLLIFLRAKEQVMLKAEQCQEKIRASQEYFVEYYKLDSFSLPNLLNKVNPENRGSLLELEALIKCLIRELTELEEQEIELEKMLRLQTVGNKTQLNSKNTYRAASKAYSRVAKPKNS